MVHKNVKTLGYHVWMYQLRIVVHTVYAVLAK